MDSLKHLESRRGPHLEGMQHPVRVARWARSQRGYWESGVQKGRLPGVAPLFSSYVCSESLLLHPTLSVIQ